MSRDIWDPQVYATYADERSRPFFDLTNRINADAPDYVVDAGCGSGELTATLRTRWPEAAVHGFDSSEAMIAKARGPGFEVADVTTWQPDRPVDVIVSNAVLQWVPTHRDVLRAWTGHLSPGGWMAVQMPGNFDAPSHRLIREVCRSGRWRERLGDFDRVWPVGSPEEYVELLSAEGLRVDAWETTYVHVLQGENAVLTWVSGTALRPIFDLLTEGEREEFAADLGERLNRAYPRMPYGTAFPFRRVFFVAQKIS